MVDLERDGFCQVVLCQNHAMLTAAHQDEGVKYVTGASSKIRGRDNIIRHMEHKESKDAKSCRETPGTNT